MTGCSLNVGLAIEQANKWLLTSFTLFGRSGPAEKNPLYTLKSRNLSFGTYIFSSQLKGSLCDLLKRRCKFVYIYFRVCVCIHIHLEGCTLHMSVCIRVGCAAPRPTPGVSLAMLPAFPGAAAVTPAVNKAGCSVSLRAFLPPPPQCWGKMGNNHASHVFCGFWGSTWVPRTVRQALYQLSYLPRLTFLT